MGLQTKHKITTLYLLFRFLSSPTEPNHHSVDAWGLDKRHELQLA